MRFRGLSAFSDHFIMVFVSYWWTNVHWILVDGIGAGWQEKPAVSSAVLGGGGGGGGNLDILVRVCGQVFWNLPQSYTWPSKNMTYSYT